MRKCYFGLLLVAMFTLFSCNNEKMPNTPQPESEEDKIVNELMAQCKDFSTEDIMLNLSGEWDLYFQLFYDDAWQAIEECHMWAGKWQPGYNIGVPEIKRFTFTPDGKGSYYVHGHSTGIPEFDDYTASFDWQYNAEDHTLILSGEYKHQFVVSGFNSEYLVLDWTDNCREIFKRKAE